MNSEDHRQPDRAQGEHPETGERPSVRPPALDTRLGALLRAHGVEIALAVTLVALTLYVRLVRLEPIENGGDPLDNWYFVRQWAYDNAPERARIDHHASRFGIHWLTWIAQTLFGTHPRVYYVAPLFASTLVTLLTYALGRLVSGRFTGFVAALLVLECPPFVSASSQLRPAIFETMYALAAGVCLVRFIDREGRRAVAWLSATAVFIFLAYLAHEPDAFLAPGAMLAVYLKRRSFRDVLLFGAVLTGLVLAETAAYALFTKYWSRIDVLGGSHLTRPGPPRSFGYLLERFTKAGDPIKLAYYPFFVAGPLLFAFRRPVRETSVVLVAGSFLFLATFFVRSIDPVIVFMQHRDRYIFATIPFAYVATLHCLVIAVPAGGAWLARRFGGFANPRTATWLRLAPMAGALVLTAFVAWRANERARKPHPFSKLDAIYDTLNDTYRRKLPIIGKVTARKPTITQARALHWAHKGFLRDEFFVEDGRLLDFKYGELARLDANHRYMPDVPDLDAERVKALEKDGCALRLSARGTVVVLSRQKRLPARCRP